MSQENKQTKQVLIWNDALRNKTGHRVRCGKIAAQISHGSLAFLTRNGVWTDRLFTTSPKDSKAAKDWMDMSFKKITLKVESEEELLEIFEKAKAAGLETHLVIDNGETEFNGPTKTVVAIGPHEADKIDPITSHLKPL